MKSWLEGADDSDFPLPNLPYGVAVGPEGRAVCVTALGDRIVDLAVLEEAGLLDAGAPVFAHDRLNPFMALGPAAWARTRARLTGLFAVDGDPVLRDDRALCARVLRPMAGAAMRLPFQVAEYTDFYAGRRHAFNVGSMFRGPENALPPNWLHMPIGYNGRASTVIVSGTPLHRPWGQLKPPDATEPVFAPCRRLDIELEMGIVIGAANPVGQPVTLAGAESMIFGYVLLNDWSARDIQAWEYQPLGPFQGKAFATSISPWVVTPAALAPFRAPAPERERPLLPYLRETGPSLYDIDLDIRIRPAGAARETVIARTNYNVMYYSPAQMLVHHSSSGCRMNVGDLLGSGTISGPDRDSFGSLLELTWGGRDPLTLEGGATRRFIEDGDCLTLTGVATGPGYRIGFGRCSGTVLPALPPVWPQVVPEPGSMPAGKL